MDRRRYNPRQKRDDHGRWAKGASNPATVSTRSSRQAARASYAAAANKKKARKATAKKIAVGAGVLAVGAVGVYAGRRSAGSAKPQAQIGSVPLQRSLGVSRPVSGGSTRATKLVTTATKGSTKLNQPSGQSFKASPVSLQRTVPKASKIKTVAPAVVKKNPTSNPVATPVAHGGAVSKVRDSTPATSPKVKSTPKRSGKSGIVEPTATPVVVTKPTGRNAQANAEMAAKMRAAGLQIGAGTGRMNNNGQFIRGAAKTTAGKKASGKGDKTNESFLHGAQTDADTARRVAAKAQLGKALPVTREATAEDRTLEMILSLHAAGKATPAQRRRLKMEGLL